MENFVEIYQMYFDDVYRYLYGLTLNESLSEELTEETFFKAMQSIKKFKGECDIRVWLCQIAKNSYFTYYRKHKRLQSGEILEFTPDATDLEMAMADKENAYRVHQILHQLPEPYKEVFSLRIFGELSFQMIGALFGKMIIGYALPIIGQNRKFKKNWRKDYEVGM